MSAFISRLLLIALALSIGLPLSPALAEEEAAAEGPWKHSVELGAILNRGNSDNSNYQARAESQYEADQWRHKGLLEASGAEESGVTTKERYLGTLDSNYKFTPRDYVFGALRLERDRFSGFEYQTSLAAGYGRKIIDSRFHSLEAEIGPGLRYSKPEGQESDSEAIGRAKAAYKWLISDSSEFGQDVLVLGGESNTEVESITALRLRVNSSLAVRLSYTVKYNSDPPPENRETDTTFAVSLVYDF
jgi:putative salt-induced outer membrane protein